MRLSLSSSDKNHRMLSPRNSPLYYVVRSAANIYTFITANAKPQTSLGLLKFMWEFSIIPKPVVHLHLNSGFDWCGTHHVDSICVYIFFIIFLWSCWCRTFDIFIYSILIDFLVLMRCDWDCVNDVCTICIILHRSGRWWRPCIWRWRSFFCFLFGAGEICI